MIKRLTGNSLEAVASLFAGWEEAMVWSCLQGCMGSAWGREETPARSALLAVGDFCFLGGEPDEALASFLIPFSGRPFVLMIPQSASWHGLIASAHAGRCEETTRYAVLKEPGVFDKAVLRRLAQAVPAGYEIRPIDKALHSAILGEAWCQDLCAQFPLWEHFAAHALGFVALTGGEIASGASTYAWYRGGIEIEVDTAPEHQRQGLAAACSARLILACLERGLYPSWDAANLTSVSLATRLGYRLAGEYTAFEICL